MFEFKGITRLHVSIKGTQTPRAIWLCPVEVFTLFNCAFVTTQNISIAFLPQIGEFANGVWEISKLGGTELI